MKQACAVAAVASSWAVGQAGADVVQGPIYQATAEVDFQTPVSHVHLLYGFDNSGVESPAVLELSAAPVTAGVFVLEIDTTDYQDYIDPLGQVAWAIVGVYDDGGSGGLATTITSWDDPTGQTYNEVFFSDDESAIVTALQTGDTDTIIPWFDDHFYTIINYFGETADVYNFSTASPNGTTALVPEPATLVLSALGLIAVVGRRPTSA
jgi:hypothetical protein